MSRSYSDTSCFVMAFGYYVINFLPYYEFLSEVNKARMVAYIPLIFLPRTHARMHARTHTHTHLYTCVHLYTYIIHHFFVCTLDFSYCHVHLSCQMFLLLICVLLVYISISLSVLTVLHSICDTSNCSAWRVRLPCWLSCFLNFFI